MKMDILKAEFELLYGKNNKGVFIYFAPGRVNLIGEHTDYNNGYVLPAAISFGTYLVARENKDGCVRLATSNFDYKAEIVLNKLRQKHEGQWVNYPLGVIHEFSKKNMPVEGLDLYYSGNIPAAAGLSSSASIELVTAVAVNDIYNYQIDRLELIHMSVLAEREFVGVQCGIMDQFIVGNGADRSALFLNCGTEQYVHVPFEVPEYRIVIADTKKIRKLSDSKYNERVRECQEGLYDIAGTRKIGSLSEMNIEAFYELEQLIKDPIVKNRVKHVVSENKRVLDAVEALKNNEFDTFGELMNTSHDSLRDDYEVTGFELDTMVEVSHKQKGVLGSRMTGAGFGGCTVSLVKESCVDDFIDNVTREYSERTGLNPEFYLPEIVEGARRC